MQKRLNKQCKERTKPMYFSFQHDKLRISDTHRTIVSFLLFLFPRHSTRILFEACFSRECAWPTRQYRQSATEVFINHRCDVLRHIMNFHFASFRKPLEAATFAQCCKIKFKLIYSKFNRPCSSIGSENSWEQPAIRLIYFACISLVGAPIQSNTSVIFWILSLRLKSLCIGK